MKKNTPLTPIALKGPGMRKLSPPYDVQAALPMGGIGAGCVCLNGQGGLQDFSVKGRPQVTEVPDQFGGSETAFGLVHIKGARPVTRLLEGPFPKEKIYGCGIHSHGHGKSGSEGLPRFKKSVFRGAYPFGQVEMRDRNVPLAVTLTGYSPFIPLDDKNSGLPCAILEYTFTNKSGKPAECEFSYHMGHWAQGQKHADDGRSRNAVIPGKGVFFYMEDDPGAEDYGSAALVALAHRPKIKAMWFRGGWFDSLSALWREISEGKFKPNNGRDAANCKGKNGGSVMVPFRLKPGESATVPVALCWHFPNRHYTAGHPRKDAAWGSGARTAAAAWRPYYAGLWKDARDAALYLHREYSGLRRKTAGFHGALFSSTLPGEVLDAVSANLGILKSPTVLRQEDGMVWAWEGCFCDKGCCHGSCTHVWNYAQALPHLFPALERTFREQEWEYCMDDRGHVNFRTWLPPALNDHGWHAAADGQLGGIMKLYRDWQICGDGAWLKKLYPAARRSLDYCIRQWDPDRKGVLVEPHHNTYDIEFWGPDGMCSSIYTGALCAMAEMARCLDDHEYAAECLDLAEKGARYLDEKLFNGEYYTQEVRYKDLRDQSFVKSLAGDYANKQELALLKKEGPKYQYGEGCLSDGVIGAWMAEIYGLSIPLSKKHVRQNLRSIHRYNLKKDLREHANTNRPCYATGDEAGLLLCSWPRGGKLTLPFPYAGEVWSGIEYQAASHMAAEGMVKECLDIVRAARERHDGRARNPWCEYECGNYYARALSSYALLQGLSGFRYSAADKTLRLAPKIKRRPFRVFFCAASGYGTLTLKANALEIDLLEGALEVEKAVLPEGEIPAKIKARAGVPAVIPLARPRRR